MIFTDPEAELLQRTSELLLRLTKRHVDDKDYEDAEVTADQIRYLLEEREKRRLPAIPADETQKAAWELYCEETAGDMHVADFWSELPGGVQQLYLEKVRRAEPRQQGV